MKRTARHSGHFYREAPSLITIWLLIEAAKMASPYF